MHLETLLWVLYRDGLEAGLGCDLSQLFLGRYLDILKISIYSVGVLERS